MPNLTLETHEKQKPIILIYGNNPLIPALLDEYSDNFKTAYIGDLALDDGRKDYYRIGKNNAQFVKNLEEKIDYAIIFLSDKNDRILIPYFIEKIVNDGTHAAIIIDIKNIELFYDVLLEYKKISLLKFLFLGDIYSEHSELNTGYPISKIINKAIRTKSITIPEKLESIFVIYYKDAIAGINQILFTQNNSIYHKLYYSEPQTVNSIAYILRRDEPDLRISYEDSKNGHNIKTHADIENGLKSKIINEPVSLDKYLDGFEKSLVNFSGDIQEEKKKSKPKRLKKSIFKPFVFSVTAAFILFALVNILLIGLGLFLLKSSAVAFQKGEYEDASSKLSVASTVLTLAEPVIMVGEKLDIKIAGWDFHQLDEIKNLMNITSDSMVYVKKIAQGIDREQLEKTISNATYGYFKLQELKSETNNKILAEFNTKNLSNSIAISQVLPIILGYSEEKNYLILFQNNGELRPTGGFIGSVGELKLNSGKSEINVQDVYEYDGKLKAHVEPHYVIRRYLQPHLYLRDSNFDPDFQNSASASALLYKLETDKMIDGVIAINFEAVRRIIDEIGPINLPSYKKTLDGKNTFDFLQTTIDNNFFPGSTQKKDVLTALLNQLLLKLENKETFIKTASLLPNLMDEKNVIFAFNNQSIQSIFDNLGYAGRLTDQRNIEEGKINDLMAVNEANIGVNKANVDVTRETLYKTTFDNKIKSQVTHVLSNTGNKEYKAYIRFFAPLGSKLVSILLDDQKQTIVPAVTDFRIYERPSFRAPRGLEVDQSTNKNLQEFGFIVSVLPHSTKKIEINYDNGLSIPNSAVITYSLSIVKQPGTSSYPLTLNLTYGKDFVPKEVENAELGDDSITIERNISTDQQLDIKLIKK